MQSTEIDGRGFWKFFAGGLLVTSGSIMVYLIATVVWTDFVHHNPNRTPRASWQMIEWSPIFGIVTSLAIGLLPITIAALGAKLVCQMAGRFFIFAIPVLLLPCVVGGLLQGSLMFRPDGVGSPDIERAITNMVGLNLPMLISFWLWARHSKESTRKTERESSRYQDEQA